jgi:hypothetical protein
MPSQHDHLENNRGLKEREKEFAGRNIDLAGHKQLKKFGMFQKHAHRQGLMPTTPI